MSVFPTLPDKKYSIIYADPPWDYKGQRQHNGKGGKETGGAEVHYPTVTLQDLKKLEISKIAATNCLLFMWTTSPHLDQAIELGKSWGFQWATVGFVWNKERVNPGFYTMSQCELCLVFKKGKIPNPRGKRNIRQYLSIRRENHSSKPSEVRERINEMFPAQEKIELFSREMLNGKWTVWGNETILDTNSHNLSAKPTRVTDTSNLTTHRSSMNLSQEDDWPIKKGRTPKPRLHKAK